MTNTLRPGLPPLPPKMRHLHIDKRGYPVPFFVAMIDGEPDHRIVDPRAMQQCVRHGRCWLCGQPLGVFTSFVVGPMCAVNRVSSEPPSHLECARYAVQACPFMARPHAKRREGGLPDTDLKQPAGIHLKRNPGVVLIWTTRAPLHRFKVPGGMLFRMGPAESMEWYAEGRPAERQEVDDSIASGLPALFEAAGDAESAGRRELDERIADVMQQVAQQYSEGL